MLKFERDAAKSESNKLKHGVPFEEAARVVRNNQRTLHRMSFGAMHSALRRYSGQAYCTLRAHLDRQ